MRPAGIATVTAFPATPRGFFMAGGMARPSTGPNRVETLATSVARQAADVALHRTAPATVRREP
jgi:hypothetical protein